MAVLVTLWGARLTFNFARKGGYTGAEDYRWAVLRGRMTPWQFEVFNLFFIVLFQNAMLVLITLPALTAYQHRDSVRRCWTSCSPSLFLALLAGETIADQQQWNFQNWQERGARRGTRAPAAVSADRALSRFSRHPNFFFEQAQWWVLFLFGAVAAGSVLQWTVLGAVLLTTLFIGSTSFTESITLLEVPGVRRLPEDDLAAHPVVPAPGARASPEVASLRPPDGARG